MKEFPKTKLMVTPEQSRLVQEKVFRMGGGWPPVWGIGSKEVKWTLDPYLFINSNGEITKAPSGNENLFINNVSTFMSVESFLALDETKYNKPWPNSFEEARKISKHWGFLHKDPVYRDSRYLICMSGVSKGYAINSRFTLAGGHVMEKYWKRDIEKEEYSFIKFDSARDLYLWLAEGEE